MINLKKINEQPVDCGDNMWQLMDADPALCPKIVILSASPPNADIFDFIHFNANN